MRKTRSWGIKTKIITDKRRNIYKTLNCVLDKFKEQKGIWKELTYDKMKKKRRTDEQRDRQRKF